MRILAVINLQAAHMKRVFFSEPETDKNKLIELVNFGVFSATSRFINYLPPTDSHCILLLLLLSTTLFT